MSAALYRVRLFWDGRKGCAKKWGREVALTVAPVLPGFGRLQLIAIDYAPEAQTAELQEYASRRAREMLREEIQAAEELLDQLRGRP